MSTYHIFPYAPLATEAAEKVRKFDANTLVAIRGQTGNYDDEYVYTVSVCPNQADSSGYCWSYVRAGDWLAEFEEFQ